MKLYMHPVSMTSRPVRLFIAENNLNVEEQLVDLMTGEHYQESFSKLNPNRQVPVLEDDGFVLTESATILRYLASKFELPSYPKDLKKRAQVDEMMDWFNTGFYREYGYGLHYPQIFPHHKRPDDVVHKGSIAWAKEKATGWMQILDNHWIGPSKQYLTGNEITIADYFGVSLLTVGEITRCNFSQFPNVNRWLNNMKKLKSWNRINEALYGFANSVKDQKFEAI
jgi:glutathione S-transferase